MIRSFPAMIAGAALAGAPGCASSSAPSDHKETQAMEDPLRAFDRNPDAVVTIRYGTEHFANGVITLRLHGDGKAEVEQLRAGQTTRDELHLPAARIAALGGALADHKLTAPRTTTLPREPGDTELLLRLDRAGAPVFNADLWYGDRYQDRDLDAVIRLADEVIHEVTQGRLGSKP